MSNPLLTPKEQAHIDSVRAVQHSPDDLAQWLARVDYHKAFIRAAQLLVLLSIAYASYKLVAIWQQYPGVAFLPFLDMHYPLMLFSGLFTANYIQHRDSEGVAIIALLSTMLNSLLV